MVNFISLNLYAATAVTFFLLGSEYRRQHYEKLFNTYEYAKVLRPKDDDAEEPTLKAIVNYFVSSANSLVNSIVNLLPCGAISFDEPSASTSTTRVFFKEDLTVIFQADQDFVCNIDENCDWPASDIEIFELESSDMEVKFKNGTFQNYDNQMFYNEAVPSRTTSAY